MGHPAQQVLDGYTPRQIEAFLFLAGRRIKRGMAKDLVVAASSRGKQKDVTGLIKKWSKGE